MLKAIISTPIGAPINHIKDFTDYSYTNKLSDFGMAKVCISCKDRSLKNREWAELKYRMDLFCTGVDLSDNDQNGKVFD